MSICVRNTIINYNDQNNGTRREILEIADNVADAITIHDIEVSNHYADSELVNIDVAGLRVSVNAKDLKAAVDNATNARMGTV